MAPDLSVLIVNYKTPAYLQACLQSFLSRSFPFSLEIVVVDNASGDESVAMVRERFPQVKLIANPYNYGFSVANNQAFRATTGRYVMPVNPDTEALPGCLEELIAFLDSHPQAGLACPVNVTSEGTLRLP